jgi:YdaS antitoxin of YdaST toxin-antitoxin system
MSRERRTIPLMRGLAAARKDCPLAPSAQATIYARTLHRACLVVGGMQQLARHLDVSEADVRRWITGEEQPPEAVFVACVEIVLLYAEQAGRST